MERVAIEHGFMSAHRYFEIQKMLTIEFRDGRKWTHGNVSREVYEELRDSEFPMLTWAVKIRQPLAENGRDRLYPVVATHAG